MIEKLLAALTPHALLLIGLFGVIFLVAAAWTQGVTYGLAATGVALLLTEWRLS